MGPVPLKSLLALCILWALPLSLPAQDAPVRGCRPVAGRQGAIHHAPRLTSSDAADHYIGERRQLVVLVSFADQTFKEADPLPLWDRVFNTHELDEPPFRGSIHDYFFAQSLGKLDLSFDMFHITLADSAARYRSTSADDENSKYLVSDLVDVLLTMDIDWQQYDWNDDGYIDQLLIVYAGKGQNNGGGPNTIWPHQWWLSAHTDCQPRTVSSQGHDYWVDSYCCVPELTGSNTYGTFGTICHEYTHCFGFPDFYYGSTKYVYGWDLMDYGNYNGSGFCPPNYSAHERMLMGWMTPTELTQPANIRNMTTSEAYLIRNDGYANEYYIVENRQQQGWDAGLPGSGVVVFHIDYDSSIWNSTTEMTNTPTRQRYTIVPANNRKNTASGWAYPYAGNDSLTDQSVPAALLIHPGSDGRTLLSKPLTHISTESGMAAFDFMGGDPTSIASIRRESNALAGRESKVMARMGPISIVRMEDGRVVKVMRHTGKK